MDTLFIIGFAIWAAWTTLCTVALLLVIILVTVPRSVVARWRKRFSGVHGHDSLGASARPSEEGALHNNSHLRPDQLHKTLDFERAYWEINAAYEG